MKLNQEEAKVLREVVGAIPQVADVIASFPPEHKAGALEAAEGGYVRAMLESGFAEPDARKWAAAVMRRLRNRVAEHDEANRKVVNALQDESSPPPTKPRFDDEQLAPERPAEPYQPREPAENMAPRAVPPPSGLPMFDKDILADLAGGDNAAGEKYAGLMRRWQATALTSIDSRGRGGLLLGASLCLGIAAGLVVSTMENATFQPYFVALFVAIGVWLLLISLPHSPKSK
jgi:hypothetical protein